MNGDDIKRIFGTTLKDIRIAKGLTQEQLAELIGKQPSTINRIETGKNFVNSETFAKLCNVLSIHSAILLTNKSQITLKEHDDYIKSITQLLQTLPQNNLKDIYRLVFLFIKHFTQLVSCIIFQYLYTHNKDIKYRK